MGRGRLELPATDASAAAAMVEAVGEGASSRVASYRGGPAERGADIDSDVVVVFDVADGGTRARRGRPSRT